MKFYVSIGSSLWDIVTECLQCKRLAQKRAVHTDGFRRPDVTVLKGDTGWVTQTDNHIRSGYVSLVWKKLKQNPIHSNLV